LALLPNIGYGYSVRGVYQMLMRQEMHNHRVVSEVAWHKRVPLKVSIAQGVFSALDGRQRIT